MASNDLSTLKTSRTAYWIHCNICYKRYIQKEHAFYLLACHHVTCGQCIVELEQSVNGPRVYKCPVCHKNTRACEINNTMPKHLKELFHPEPYLDGLNNFQIMTFQEKHRRSFMEYIDREAAEEARLKQEVQKLKESVRKSFQEYETAKAERRHLENIVRRLERQDMDDNRSSSSSSGYSSAAEKFF